MAGALRRLIKKVLRFHHHEKKSFIVLDATQITAERAVKAVVILIGENEISELNVAGAGNSMRRPYARNDIVARSVNGLQTGEDIKLLLPKEAMDHE